MLFELTFAVLSVPVAFAVALFGTLALLTLLA